MLDVRPVDVAARELEVRLDRLARVVGVADDQPADDEHAVAVQVLDGRGCVALPTRAPVLALRRSWRRPSGTPGRRRARSRCRGTRSGSRPAASAAPASRRARRSARSSPARCSRCRSRPASMIAWHSASKRCTSSVMLSSTRKIARAPWPRASRMSASTRSNRVRVEVPAAHLDDRAEAAVEGAAARRLDDVDRPAEQRVAAEHARAAVGQPQRAVASAVDRPGRVVHGSRRRSRHDSPAIAASGAAAPRARAAARGTSARPRRAR